MPHQRSCVQSERAGASGYRAGSPARGAARVGRMGRPRGGAELPITDAVSLQYSLGTGHGTQQWRVCMPTRMRHKRVRTQVDLACLSGRWWL